VKLAGGKTPRGADATSMSDRVVYIRGSWLCAPLGLATRAAAHVRTDLSLVAAVETRKPWIVAARNGLL
jgi:hypothetical protein